MRYAESKLLCGNLIHARDNFAFDYKELEVVSPVTKRKVELGYSRKNRNVSESEKPEFIEWVLCEGISNTELGDYRIEHKRIESQFDAINNKARRTRINRLKPNLLEIIKSSAILSQPINFDGCTDVWENSLIKWFVEILEVLASGRRFQDAAEMECRKLYLYCIKPALENKHYWIPRENIQKFTKKNHLTYGSKIASEMLKYALAKFEGSNQKILIYLGVNEAVQESMKVAGFVLSVLLEELLTKKNQFEFQQLWHKDKYQGMTKVREFSETNQDFCKIYNLYIKKITYQFTINLALIFWFVPWLDELKKLNQQPKPNNIC